MAEVKKRIVIASVLKPLNDTRMTEKIASTLASDPNRDVHVIGFPSAIPGDARITFHTFAAFKRLSVARWFAPARILRTILQIRPDIIIITTHELLAAGAIAKLLLRAKLIYDVQENYYLNILYSNAFSAPIRWPVALYVRLKEKIFRPMVDHFFLAERVYAQQLRFLPAQGWTVLENKAKKLDLPRHPRVPMQLVFTGTLSRSTGVFRAIELAKGLHALDRSVTLQIVGYAALPSERKELLTAISHFAFIELVGGSDLVSHEVIVRAILSGSAGIISYDLSPASRGRIPTKLYEYLNFNLPVIFTDCDPAWRELAMKYEADFHEATLDQPNSSTLLEFLRRPKNRGTFHHDLSWENEESALETAISAF